MKEQELLFTAICTSEHSYVPKSSLSPVSSLPCLWTEMPSRSLLHMVTDEDISTRVVQLMYGRTHTVPHMYFTATNGGNALESTNYYSLWPQEANRCSGIYVKQLSTRSSQLENYSNKDAINGTISLFQSNLWIWMNSDWRGTLTKPCGSMVIKHHAP